MFKINCLFVIILLLFFVSSVSVYGQGASNYGFDLRPSDRPLSIDVLRPVDPGIAIPLKLNEELPTQDHVKSKQKIIELDSIVFEGNTIFQNEELSDLVKSYLHKPATVDELDELRRKITHYYIDKGYITSGATFPPNPIQGNTLHIKIIEGKIEEIRTKGEMRLRKNYIKNRLFPNKNAPVNMSELQDQFRLLLTDPLFERLNGRLLASTNKGSSILDIEVLRSRPYQFSVISDNYRAPSVGAIALGANSWIRNLTGQGDTLDFTFMTSAPAGGDAFQYSGSWAIPIGDYGTQSYFSFNKANVSIIEQPLSDVDIKSDTFSVEGGINQTLVSSLKRRLTLGAGLAFKENDTTISGHSFSFIPGLPNGNNRISVVRVNQEYIERWEKFVLAFRSTFSIGQDLFGATIQRNHRNPDSDFFGWLGQTRGLWNLPYIKSDLVLKGAVQISSDPLLPLERIAVGGRNSVRGYRENQLVRDSGYAGSAELHIHITGNNLTKYRFDLIPFFDYGAAWNHGDTTLVTQTIQHLYSAGIGFQYRFHHFIGEFFWAHRLANNTVKHHGDLQDQGIHFQVRMDAF